MNRTLAVAALVLALAAASPGAAITSNGTGGGNLSAGASWAGGVAPVSGDTIVVANGDTITVDANITLGDNVSSVGHAFTVNGASSSSFGTLKVAAGVTLTLRGTNTTTNTLGLVNRWGQFQPQPGSTILGDCASDYQSIILNKGQVVAVGTSGSPITFSSPAANLATAWSNPQTDAVASTPNYAYDQPTGVAALSLTKPWVANNAGTGPGSFGDSSLAISGASPAGLFTREVASLGAIAAPGDYAVNYDFGVVYFKHDYVANVAVTFTYKYLTMTRGWGIQTAQGTSFNSADFRYCNFRYMGGSTTSDNPVLWGKNCLSAGANAGAADRIFRVRNCTFTNCNKAISLNTCTGTQADPILVDANTFNHIPNDVTGSAVYFFRCSNSYVSVTNNTLNTRAFLYSIAFGTVAAQTGLVVSGNAGLCAIFLSGATLGTTAPDGLVSGNVIDGPGFGGGASGGFDHRLIAGFGGSAGHPLVISGNTFRHVRRQANYAPYLTIERNAFGYNYHHGLIAPVEDDLQCVQVTIRDNLFYGGSNMTYNGSPSIESGYNHRHWVDQLVVANNTIANTYAGIGIGDCQDNQGNSLLTRAEFKNNLIVGTRYAYIRATDTTAEVTRAHVLELDYNLRNGQTSATTLNYNGSGTFSLAGQKYNYLASGSRNVPGVALANPSYTSAQAGMSLALAVNAADADVTLAWGGGTPQQLIFGAAGTGTAASAAGVTTTGIAGLQNGTFAVAGTPWSTTLNAAACPRGHWLKITSGRLAGTIRAITSNTASQLTIVPSWPYGIITGATNASPIVVTSAGHGRATGDTVNIVGVNGNAAANGTFLVTVIDANTFSLNGSTGSGAYSSGGAWYWVPAAGDGYAIYKSEVVLADSGGVQTVNAGVYLPDLPTASATDTGIALDFHDVTGSPALANPNGTTAADYRPTAGSAAMAAGTAAPNVPTSDYFGVAFGSPPAIGFAGSLASAAASAILGGLGLPGQGPAAYAY